MNIFFKARLLLCMGFMLLSCSSFSQILRNVIVSDSQGLKAYGILMSDSNSITFQENRQLYSFRLNDKLYNSGEAGALKKDSLYTQAFDNRLNVSYRISHNYDHGTASVMTFENTGTDTLSISNVVPFGEDAGSVYITGNGPWDLARAWLFRPGFQPLRVILPDNAWELGYSSFSVSKDASVCSLARRLSVEGGQKKRYETSLPPKAKVTYSIHSEVFKGDWQTGLRTMFRDRYLFDLDKFDNSLYEREDLAWIKGSYLIILQMAWDREFYDRLTGKYNFADFLKRQAATFGYTDVFGIWPTWPRLGLDQRNQWDLYRDLPGGTPQLRNFARLSRISGTRFFIAYNPWDNSTRKEDHYRGMAQLISETEADGVVLDTRGSSSYELQAAADSVRKGVVMFSEGMAVTKDMPGIISGRVHNAIFLSPELNLNKLIKPDFSIFRVCDVGEDIIHREIAIAFFNGYGTELNMFRPGGRNEKFAGDMAFLSKTTFILRQNNDAFLDNDWTPLIKTTMDKVFVNRWNSGEKTLYTILSMIPSGVDGKLFEADTAKRKHFVSLWNHENVNPVFEKGKIFLPAHTAVWPDSFSGTRQEGSVDCIASFPDIIKSKLAGDSIKINSGLIQVRHDTTVTSHAPASKISPLSLHLRIWKGEPSYQAIYKEFRLNDTTISIKSLFGNYEGKIVLQLLDNKILIDENILVLKGGAPWIISKVARTERSHSIPSGMVLVPGTVFSFKLSTNEDFFIYPETGSTQKVESFLIDKYPVTNAQYYEFIERSGYRPTDTTRYLRHWEDGKFRQGQEKYPVVYVSYEDMQAYCKWAGKRLPTQAEWQLAAQGTDNRKWPWGSEFHGTYCNNSFDKPTPVDAFSKGQSVYGVCDLVGNVWQMTNDMYFNGSNYFTVIRGGSYYKPESSWWYIQGGPQSLDKTQIMLMVSEGYDRSSTVGFRCVKDTE